MIWVALWSLAWAQEDPLTAAREDLAVLVASTDDAALRLALEGIDAKLAAAQGVDATGSPEPEPAPVVIALPPPPPLPSAPACSPEEYDKLRTQVDAQPFSGDKIAVVEKAGARLSFTVDQVLGLLDVLDFNADKIQAAALLHPKVIDPDAFDQVYEVLVFEHDRDALRGLVEAPSED